MSPFSLKPLQFNSIPTLGTIEYDQFKKDILKSANEILKSIPSPSNKSTSSWKKNKTFNKLNFPTISYSTLKSSNQISDTEGYKWHARISNHKTEFEKFQFLLKDHSINEAKYIGNCSDAELITIIEKGVMEVWRMSYKLDFPITNREFLILILTISTGENSFQVISIPIEHQDASLRKDYVRGRYVSIEDVLKNEGEIIWTMATASNAGGRVPKFVTEMVMPGATAEDVPSYMNWSAKQ